MTITHTSFLLLLALAKQPGHGYAIAAQVATDTNNTVKLGPGTLYTALKQLDALHLIESMPIESDSRRHTYRLTKRGWDIFEESAGTYLAIAGNIPNRLSLD